MLHRFAGIPPPPRSPGQAADAGESARVERAQPAWPRRRSRLGGRSASSPCSPRPFERPDARHGALSPTGRGRPRRGRLASSHLHVARSRRGRRHRGGGDTSGLRPAFCSSLRLPAPCDRSRSATVPCHRRPEVVAVLRSSTSTSLTSSLAGGAVSSLSSASPLQETGRGGPRRRCSSVAVPASPMMRDLLQRPLRWQCPRRNVPGRRGNGSGPSR